MSNFRQAINFLKLKYFAFVSEFQIIEKYGNGKGRQVGIVILYSKCIKNGLTR